MDSIDEVKTQKDQRKQNKINSIFSTAVPRLDREEEGVEVVLAELVDAVLQHAQAMRTLAREQRGDKLKQYTSYESQR
jgi:hypothetical protein